MAPSILAVDIGGGTQDIVLYDPDQPMENAVKLVLPSPTVIAARRIGRATERKQGVFLSGRVMGGGAVVRAVRDHLAAGLAVYSLEGPALTVHDNLDKIRSMGVLIVEKRPDDHVEEVVLGDLDPSRLNRVLDEYEIDRPDIEAVAVQDHGFSPDASNRLTRFAQWQQFLDSGGEVGSLLFTAPPENLTRWVAAADVAPGAFFMDTSAAALRGAILDPYAAERLNDGLLVVNVGNDHTVAFLVSGRRVWGVYEHHTSLLTPTTLADHLHRFATGHLSHEEVFDGMGHGVAYRPGYMKLKPFQPVVVTGPQRRLADGLGYMAAPYGEMMLSGCFGLIRGVREHMGLDDTDDRPDPKKG